MVVALRLNCARKRSPFSTLALEQCQKAAEFAERGWAAHSIWKDRFMVLEERAGFAAKRRKVEDAASSASMAEGGAF